MIKDRMREYYRLRAGSYEQIYYRDHPGRRAELAAECERLEKLAVDRRVLELACGTGYWTEVMSRTARQITAIDISSEMLAEAAHKEFGCPVELIEADMFGGLPEIGRFDLVAIGFWFSHQPRQAFDELFDRLEQHLAEGGQIWMTDNNPSAEGGVHKSLRIDEQGNHFQMRSLPDGSEYEILKNYFSREELESIFKPRYEIVSLVHGDYYWSAVLLPREGN